ncbi:Ferroportin1 [Necator americanus]|uniref:Solute carrier family 40 member n=1 Tax=Necator americanus TaxID=51031 RepID=W2T7M6_NECAM|nr:Ferroportin1 [Necator americanus]ETN77629.1 Ferroportin1 [Necator americanus]
MLSSETDPAKFQVETCAHPNDCNAWSIGEDRAWSFCVSLCMQGLGGMRMVSIEQFAESIGQMILSGHLGRTFDRVSRKNARIVLEVHFEVKVSCAYWERRHARHTDAGICPQAKPEELLVTTCGLRVTCAIFGGFSIVSMTSKAFFLRALYLREPQLAVKDTAAMEENTGKLFFNCQGEIVVTEKKATTAMGKIARAFESIPEVLLTYTRQSVVAAAFGMALLFMTVMGFDGLAVGYGQSSGLSDVVLGAFRSYGSAMGILGALSYAFFERRLGVRKTGLLGLTKSLIGKDSSEAGHIGYCRTNPKRDAGFPEHKGATCC